MRILVIMAGFLPGKKYGGPPISVENFCTMMAGDECFILTLDHDKAEKTPYVGIESGKWIKRDNCSVMYLPDEEYNKRMFKKVMNELNPDILYLQGMFQSCILPCLQLAKEQKIRVLLAPRGELCPGAFKKKYKKIPYIYYLRLNGLLKNVFFQSTSKEETLSIEKYLKTNESKVYFLPNIPSVPKRRHQINIKKAGEGRFVFLSRIHPKKNLIYAIKCFATVKDIVTLDIYGPIEDRAYWLKCREEINKLPGNVTVNYRGIVSHDEVHEVFGKYDAFIFPTFSENYGHVIAESLIIGTPVIISDQTPWNDVVDNDAGWVIPLERRSGFVNAIQQIINKSEEEQAMLRHRCAEYVRNKIGYENLRLEYQEIFKVICAREI